MGAIIGRITITPATGSVAVDSADLVVHAVAKSPDASTQLFSRLKSMEPDTLTNQRRICLVAFLLISLIAICMCPPVDPSWPINGAHGVHVRRNPDESRQLRILVTFKMATVSRAWSKGT